MRIPSDEYIIDTPYHLIQMMQVVIHDVVNINLTLEIQCSSGRVCGAVRDASMKSRRGSDEAADHVVEVIITVAPWAESALRPSETILPPVKVCYTHQTAYSVTRIFLYLKY